MCTARADTTAGNGKRECRTCHTDHKGRNAKIVQLDEHRFDHAKTDFALRAAHVKTEMPAPATARTAFRKTPTVCNECHRKDDKHKGNLGKACADCHIESNWKDWKFDHDKTRFRLKAKHVDVTCKNCHAGDRYKDTPKDCFGCHKKDDTHKGRLGTKCDSCHDERNWKRPSTITIATRKFPLRDKHRAAKCETCHKTPLGTLKLPTTCIGCHRADDVHKGNLGPKCESCHGERTWKTSSFNHDKDTKFISATSTQE